MPEWSTACPDWSERIVQRRTLIPFSPLFPASAADALGVFKSLRIADLAGQPTFGEVCEQWVFDFVASIFGANDPETGNQLISEFFLLISKKNSKSTIAAGIMLTALIINWRPAEELLILAPRKEVADNSFKPAADMVRADEELSARFHVQDHLRTITDRLNGAALKVVAADTDTVGGKKAGRVLVDELWIFGSRKNAKAMLQEALGGLFSRPEGFVIYLTTQSDKPPAGVFKEKLDYGRDVRDGKIHDPKFLPVIYEFPEAMIKSAAYLEPRNFYVTNPNMGRSVQQDDLARELQKELQGTPEGRATFLAKHLNVEIGMNLRANRWAGADHWTKRADTGLTLDAVLDRSEVIVVGIDGGGLDDLFGLCVLGREADTKHWLAWSHAWAHHGILELRQKIAPRLRDFEKEGSLTFVSDELEDVSEIIGIIDLINQRGLLGAVAVDPAGLGELVDQLAEIGVTQDDGLLIGAPQGYAMMNAIKTTERRLVNGTLWHDGSALMDWCVSNLKIEPTATAIRASKQNAGEDKIDPVMALYDAVQVMSRNPEAKADGQNMDSFFASLRSKNENTS